MSNLSLGGKMSEQVEIVMAQPADAAKILGLLRTVQTQSNFVTITAQFERLSVASEAHSIEQINQTDDNLMMLAKLGDQLVGLVTVSRIPDTNAGEIGIAVDKPFWGMKIGTALLDEAIYWFETFSALRQLQLSVVADNERAIGLYQKMAFTKTSEQVITHDGQSQTIIEMVRSVSD